MVEYIGRNSGTDRPDWGFISPGQMRGFTPNKTSKHLWVYQLGIWAGKYTPQSSANVVARLGLYATSSGNPGARLGYSAQFTVSTPMADSVSGASHTANVALVDVDAPSGVTFSGIPITSGSTVHLAALGTSGYLAYGMIEAAKISATNESFYTRSGVSQPPPDPFGAYVSSNEGHMSIWAAADANVAPGVPNFRVPSGDVLDLAPTFEARFNDANRNRGDYLNQYRIQMRRKSDGVSFWNATFTATAAERTPDGSNIVTMRRAYGGTTMVRGTQYEWRVQMSDHFGAWSDWSTWLEFTPTALGTITLDGSPSGKIETNQPSFAGKWTHQSGTSMKRVQVRLWSGDGKTLLQTGANFDIADVSSSAAPGTAFTLPWANAGLTALAWGTKYQFDMRGYDGTQWSGYSSKRSFNTNAAPSVPSGLSPANNMITSSAPILSCNGSDVDDTTGTGLVFYARLKSSAGAVLSTKTMTYDAPSKRWQYQLDGGQNEIQQIAITGDPTGGTFTLTFGGDTTSAIPFDANSLQIQSALEALASIGAGNVTVDADLLVTFRAALGITNVAQITATSSLTGGSSPAVTISTVTGGSRGDFTNGFGIYRWDSYGYDGTIYSGEASSEATATKSAEAVFSYVDGPAVTVTAPLDGATLATSSVNITWLTTNQASYRVILYANDTDEAIYDSGVVVSEGNGHLIPGGYVKNNTAYDLVVSVVDANGLTGLSTIIDIDIAYPETDIVAGFTVGAASIGTDVWDSAITLEWEQTLYPTDVWQEYTISRRIGLADHTILARITSPTQTQFTDYTPASGVEHTYAITQTIMTGLDMLESEEATAAASVHLGGIVLVSLSDPAANRTALRYTNERNFDRTIREASYEPVSGALPTTVRSKTYYRDISFDVQLFDDAGATADTRRREIETIDESGDTFCYRDNHGRKLFVTAPKVTIKDRVPDWFVASIALREENFREGVE